MRQRLIATSGVLVVLLGGCGSTAPALEPTTAGLSVNGASQEAAAAGDVDDVLDLVCLANGTVPNALRVVAQEDGVHFHIVNASGKSLGFEIKGIGGDNVPKREGTLVWQVPPGVANIRCNSFEPDDPPWIEIEILDPGGFSVPDRVTCAGNVANGIFDYVSGAKGRAGDPVALTRQRYAGMIRAGDVVEHAGFAVSGEQKVRVVRDGIVEIVVTYRSDGAGGWLVDSDVVCQDDMLP